LRLFPSPVCVNGRLVLVGDGIKIPKRGRKMPAVKLLHQQSQSNTKPEYIMGHSMQAVGLLVHAAKSVFSVPLAVRIHEGLVWSNRDKRTLLDKMLGLLDILLGIKYQVQRLKKSVDAPCFSSAFRSVLIEYSEPRRTLMLSPCSRPSRPSPGGRAKCAALTATALVGVTMCGPGWKDGLRRGRTKG